MRMVTTEQRSRQITTESAIAQADSEHVHQREIHGQATSEIQSASQTEAGVDHTEIIEEFQVQAAVEALLLTHEDEKTDPQEAGFGAEASEPDATELDEETIRKIDTLIESILTENNLTLESDVSESAEHDITLGTPTSTESVVESLEKLFALPTANETTTATIDAGQELSPDDNPLPPRPTIRMPEASPQVQELDAAILGKIDSLPDEEAEAVHQTLAEIVETINAIETIVIEAQHSGKSIDIEAIKELEQEAVETCRQLLAELGIEADDETIGNFVRHLILTHAAERVQTTADGFEAYDEGTHESKYFGNYMWRRLKYFVKQKLNGQHHLVGRYALALDEFSRAT